MEQAFKIAHYLLENGPILEDGETVDLFDDEQVLVRFGPSTWDKSATVIRLSPDYSRLVVAQASSLFSDKTGKMPVLRVPRVNNPG
jgi:hypothetical protein